MTTTAASSLAHDRHDDVLVGAFRIAMRRLAASVALITTEEAGQRHGMAATAVASLGIAPPSMVICVSTSASIHGPIARTGRFAVNLLRPSHAALVPLFSGTLKGEERFAHGAWRDFGAVPVLGDAQAVIVCAVETQLGYAGHTIFVGRVEQAVADADVDPLCYSNGVLGIIRPLADSLP